MGDDVAVFHVDLAFEQLRVGRVADGDEDTGERQLAGRAVDRALEAHAGDAGLVAQHFIQRVVPFDAHVAGLGLGEQLVAHDRLAAEAVTPVHHRDRFGDVREIQCFFHRGVAATDHGDVLALEEEAVAGGAGRDALAHERLFGRQPEILRRCPGRDDQRIAGVGARVAFEAERFLAQGRRVNMVVDEFGVEALGVLLEAGHQIRPLDAHGVGRPVVDVGGGHQLAAGSQPGDDHRLQVGAGGVDRGGVAGRAGTEDQQGDVAGCVWHGDS